MKIEIILEVDDVRHPPPGARWDTRFDWAESNLRTLISYVEKNRHGWNNCTIVADGDTRWQWEEGRATEAEIKDMRRMVVEEAMAVPIPPWRLYEQYKERFGKDYQLIVDEYEVDPEAPWVRKLRSSIKSSQKRAAKKVADREAEIAEHTATEGEKRALIRELVKDEDIRQQTVESQGGERILKERIKEMVAARIEGRGEFDPRPADDAERLLWGRISRAVETQATFKTPPRFYGHIDDGRGGFVTVSFDF